MCILAVFLRPSSAGTLVDMMAKSVNKGILGVCERAMKLVGFILPHTVVERIPFLNLFLFTLLITGK
jgi:hypothetical protein